MYDNFKVVCFAAWSWLCYTQAKYHAQHPTAESRHGPAVISRLSHRVQQLLLLREWIDCNLVWKPG